MTDRLLEVGDKVVQYWRKKPEQILSIDRVTNTLAFSGDFKFKRTISEYGNVSRTPYDRFDIFTYSILNLDKRQEVEHFIKYIALENRFRKVVFSDLTNNQIDGINAILDEV